MEDQLSPGESLIVEERLRERIVTRARVIMRSSAVILFQLITCTLATAHSNKFGIGCYDDTDGSPPINAQLDAASALVGNKGFVVLYLCAWRTRGQSCLNETTPGSDSESREKLAAAYARNLTVVARIGNPYVVRDHADVIMRGSGKRYRNRTSYRRLAAAYARFIMTLPLPPHNTSLYVTIGNEFNACNEWRYRQQQR